MALEGDLIRLREERDSDLPLLVKLRNDLDTQAWGKALPPDYTEGMYRQRMEDRKFSFDRNDGRFIIEFIENEEPIGIGYIGFSSVTYRMDATVGIMLDKKYWGSGVAFEAQELMLKFLFEEIGVRVIRLWTQTSVPRAIGLA
ncbi:MAG: GNAT family N-acetyltransferase, partial [Gammaproteobacteria bacterium]|nr:GNAT family N-acetyltransferase [Gammaproteobacteria bacterium]